MRSVFHGRESIWYLGPKIWDIVPLEWEELVNDVVFKKSIKEWTPKTHVGFISYITCRLCQKYLSSLEFITVTS